MNLNTLKARIRETLEFVRMRRRDYLHTFRTPAGQRVLEDLARFCHANTTCFAEDPRVHAVYEGRREVFLRIQSHLNLSPEQLYAILGGVTLQNFQQEEDDG